MMVSNDTIEFLKLRLQANPDSYLFARLADNLLAMGNVNEAIQVCERGIKTHPYYVSGHFVMGKCYFRKRMYEQAEKEFKRVLFFDSKYLSAHKYYAETMEHLGWSTAIETAYKKILEIDPFDEDTRKRYQAILEQKRREKKVTQSTPVFDTWDRDIPEAAPEEPPQVKPEKPPLSKTRDFQDESAARTFGEKPEPKSSEPDWSDVIEGTEESEETKETPPAPSPQMPVDDSDDQLFEEVIEEEPPSAADVEKFSYILDDIFREEAVVESDDDRKDEFSFFDNFDEEVSERPAPPIEKPTAMGEEEVAEMVFGTPDMASESEPDPLEELSQIEQEMHTETEEKTASDAGTEFPEKAESGGDSEKVPEKPKPPDEPVPPDSADKKTPSDTPTPPAVREEELASIEDLARDIDQATPRPKPKPEPVEEERETEPEQGETRDTKKKKEKIVTPTLGEIYAAQAQYAKAIGVFELLRKKEPTNTAYVEKIKYLKKKLEETMNK